MVFLKENRTGDSIQKSPFKYMRLLQGRRKYCVPIFNNLVYRFKLPSNTCIIRYDLSSKMLSITSVLQWGYCGCSAREEDFILGAIVNSSSNTVLSPCTQRKAIWQVIHITDFRARHANLSLNPGSAT